MDQVLPKRETPSRTAEPSIDQFFEIGITTLIIITLDSSYTHRVRCLQIVTTCTRHVAILQLAAPRRSDQYSYTPHEYGRGKLSAMEQDNIGMDIMTVPDRVANGNVMTFSLPSTK